MPRYDIQEVKSAAQGRWPEIFQQLCAIPSELCDGRHHECPMCGGKDRFRLIDEAEGALLCNQCFTSQNGDGIQAVMWKNGVKKGEAIKSVAEYLGVKPSKNGKYVDPAQDLRFLPWFDTIPKLWCLVKPPIKIEAIKAVGGRLAKYRGEWTVIALPVWGAEPGRGDPVGWLLYASGGKDLPKYLGKGKVDMVKCKLTYGSKPGVIAPTNLYEAETVWKVEGGTDILAMLSLDLPDGVSAFTTANGAQENPKNHRNVVERLDGKNVHVLHDADAPGQAGATWIEQRGSDKKRPGWVPCLAGAGATTRNVQLPYQIQKVHGKDLRDYLNEGHGYDDLVQLAEASPVSEQTDLPSEAIEKIEDPNRLARINLRRYKAKGRTLRRWRGSWYSYKGDRYAEIPDDDLKAKVWSSIKVEFDEQNIIDQEDSSDEPPAAMKVSRSLVNDVISATASMCLVPNSVELNTWITDEGRTRRNLIAMKNGIVDMDALLGMQEDVLLDHSEEWFSLNCLEYEFNPEADCPKWKAFLHRNLQGDRQRMAILQEWAGYLLLPETGLQKFLVLEGEGSNGKSVCLAGIQAILGSHNCAFVPLEVFGQRFALTPTLGKLCNIAGDTGEIDKVAEGFIKSFTSGDMMNFDRKNKEPVQTTPSCRLMMSCNTIPRFADKSEGVWRRMIPVPFLVEIPENERVQNMDKAWWWEQSGELPGMFMWAVKGLYRLRHQGKFTISDLVENKKNDLRMQNNPAREFLADSVEQGSSGDRVDTKVVYKAYRSWCGENGYQPMSANSFGREVNRIFDVRRVRARIGGIFGTSYDKLKWKNGEPDF